VLIGCRVLVGTCSTARRLSCKTSLVLSVGRCVVVRRIL